MCRKLLLRTRSRRSSPSSAPSPHFRPETGNIAVTLTHSAFAELPNSHPGRLGRLAALDRSVNTPVIRRRFASTPNAFVVRWRGFGRSLGGRAYILFPRVNAGD